MKLITKKFSYYYLPKSDLRKNQLNDLKSSINSQQTVLDPNNTKLQQLIEQMPASRHTSHYRGQHKCQLHATLQRTAQTPASCYPTEKRISQIGAHVGGKMIKKIILHSA